MMAGPWPKIFKEFRYSHKLWIFPLVAGISWFTTLSILLIRWVAIGRPRYPGQVNPDIPFVSDIAAFTFQPVFIAGCAITGVAFVGTVFAVQHVRYSPEFYGLTDDALWRQNTSFVALFTGFLAATSLILLSIFDTFENNDEHQHILMCVFAGLGAAGLLTTAVWCDQIWGTVVFVGLRKWCLFNTLLVLSQTALGLAFVIFMYTGRYRIAGFLEWTLCYIGSFWLVSFVGYIRFREGKAEEEIIDERQPLLPQ